MSPAQTPDGPSDRDADRPANLATPADDQQRVTFYVRGRVQGVGFRWWTRSRALELGLVGHARNCADGRVEVLAQGDARAIATLEEWLRQQPSTTRPPRPGHVDLVVAQPPTEPRPDLVGFRER